MFFIKAFFRKRALISHQIWEELPLFNRPSRFFFLIIVTTCWKPNNVKVSWKICLKTKQKYKHFHLHKYVTKFLRKERKRGHRNNAVDVSSQCNSCNKAKLQQLQQSDAELALDRQSPGNCKQHQKNKLSTQNTNARIASTASVSSRVFTVAGKWFEGRHYRGVSRGQLSLQHTHTQSLGLVHGLVLCFCGSRHPRSIVLVL